MNRESRVAAKSAGEPVQQSALVAALAEVLIAGALPDEIEGFGESQRAEAARFVAATARKRSRGKPAISVESIGESASTRRRMRLCLVNDDMPFIVDSVAAAVAAQGLIVHRLLHPVLPVTRDERGELLAVGTGADAEAPRESFLYLETDRAAANQRHQLVAQLQIVLEEVRAAVDDWPALQAKMRSDAGAVEDEEAAALLNWFADGALTLLGYQVERPGKPASDAIGLLRCKGDLVWDVDSSAAAIDYFKAGGRAPLIAKADRRSSVHRRVPFDLVVLPIREQGEIVAIGVHAGLWTSQAMRAAPEEVPVLRRRLAMLEEEFGFDPRGHAGKGLRHAVAALPRDLLVSLNRDSVKRLVATAMSLADRPRATLELLQSILKGHLFAFVWLPREELATERRLAIGGMLEEAAQGTISNWTVELGDGDLSLIRYTIDVDPRRPLPDAAALNARIDAMLRGWEPGVEEALGPLVGAPRAARLGLTLVRGFPESYRSSTGAAEAAEDVARFAALRNADARAARLLRRPTDGPSQLRLKTYRRGDMIPLSEAVPVLENFGFRVLEEQPTP
ncbi:MAG: glutamate dehydrogenase, partial [Sphingomonadales bacterium]